MRDGMLMNKAGLFIAVEGLFMCTGAWVEIALTFSISVPLYCKDVHLQLCLSVRGWYWEIAEERQENNFLNFLKKNSSKWRSSVSD